MTVKVDVPIYARVVADTVNATSRRALVEVENTARLTAPVDTGFYRNNIQRDEATFEVVANAEYSAPIEYGVGGTKRRPNPVMRNAARMVQNKIGQLFVRELKKRV